MEKSSSAICIVLGVILVYLSFFGLTGLSIPFALSQGFTDTFNDGSMDTTRWEVMSVGGQTVNEQSGQLQINPDGSGQQCGGYVTKDAYDLSNGGTITVDLIKVRQTTRLVAAVLEIATHKITSSRNDMIDDHYRIQVDAETYVKVLKRISGLTTKIGERNAVPSQLRIIVSDGSISLGAHYYGAWHEVGTEPCGMALRSVYVYLLSGYSTTNNIGEVSFDNFMLTSGGGPPPSDKGDLNVKGYYDGVAVSCTDVYYIGSSGSSSPITVIADGHTWYSIAVGSYTVYGSYQGTKTSDSVSVQSGKTVYAQLDFGGSPPPPPNGDGDFFEWINQIFTNPTVKSVLLIGGIGLAGIGFIGLVIPRRRTYTPASPHYY